MYQTGEMRAGQGHIMSILTQRGSFGRSVAFSLLTVAGFSAGAAFSATNLGFENGPTGNSAPGWDLSAPSDSATVTDGDGAEFQIYDQFNITVPPIRNEKSLRLGTPKQVNESQNRGENIARSDAFTPGGDQVFITFEVFSFEHRGDDRLIFEVLDAATDIPLTNVSYTLTPQGSPDLPAMVTAASLAACTAGSVCELVIDVGKRNKRPKRSGIYLLAIDLPDTPPSAGIRLRYTVLSGNNEAHATWAYFDNFNQPPVAAFSCTPNDEGMNINAEGDLTFCDARGELDPDGDDVTYSWSASGGGLSGTRTVDGPAIAAFAFPDGSSTATITLTVTDEFGAASLPVSKSIHVSDAAPFVNAVNATGIDGRSVELTCRLADSGVNDMHSMTIDVDGLGSFEVELFEENTAPFASGYGSVMVGPLSADEGPYTGTCTVQTISGGLSGWDDFVIEVLNEEQIANLEDIDVGDVTGAGVSPAPAKNADWGYVLRIDDELDTADVFEIRRSDGSALRYGDTIAVQIKGITDADLDGALLIATEDSTVTSPLQGVTWKTAPLQGVPLQGVPLQGVPLQGVPLQGVPLQGVPVEETTLLATAFSTVPLQGVPVPDVALLTLPLQGVPLETSPLQGVTVNGAPIGFSQLPLDGITLGLDNNSISSLHIGLTEAGGPNLGEIAAEPVQPVAISANFGAQDEQLVYSVGPGVTAVFFVLFPHAGPALDNATTTARVEVFERLDRNALPAEFCEGAELVSQPTNTTQALPGLGVPLSMAKTLVVTDYDRALRLRFDNDPTAADAFFAEMNASYFNHPKVMAHVVSTRGDLYHSTNADLEPCNTEAQNELARGIREEIRALIGDDPLTTTVEMPNAPAVKDILFLFGYDVQGPFYTLDRTVVGNEVTFGPDLGVRFNSPLRAMVEGNNVTDACHGDFTEQTLAGAPLCIEDIAVARWTGDPSVILQEADSFAASNGILLRYPVPGSMDTDNELSCLAMGYDFFSGSTILAKEEVVGLTTSSECYTTEDSPYCVNEEWNSDRAREEYLGECEGCEVKDLNIFNAHASYNVLAPPVEYRTGDFANMLTVDEITDQLLGRGTISLGCHFALPVPQSYAWQGDLLFPSTQNFSAKPGLIIGNTGYGVGDTDVDDLMSEAMLTRTVKFWAAGMPISQAARWAKIDYALSREPFGVQDADAIMIWRVDGPPQYELTESAFAVAAASSAATDNLSCFGEGSVALTLEGLGNGAVYNYPIERCTLTDEVNGEEIVLGDYWRYGGEAQGDATLPLQPTQTPIAERLVGGSNPHIKGVVIRSGTFIDQLPAGETNPVFLRYQTDFTAGVLEAQPCVQTLQPVQLGVAKTFDTTEGTLQSFTFTGGQFQCMDFVEVSDDNHPNGVRVETRGLMRTYDGATMDLTSSFDPAYELDFVPPTFEDIDLSVDSAGQNVVATLLAVDDTSGMDQGIAEYVAAVFYSDVNGGPGYVETYSTNDAGVPPLPLQGPQTLILPADTDPDDGIELLFGFYAIGMDGTVASRFNKGRKIRPIGVEIISVVLRLEDLTDLVVEIEDFASLVNPFITIEIDGVEIIEVQLLPGDVQIDADGTGVYTTSLDLTDVGDSAEVTVTVQDLDGAFGTDSRFLIACTDPVDLGPGLAHLDIESCDLRVEDDTIVTVELFMAGDITDDGQYRWVFPGLGDAQFKVWNKGKKRSSPSGVRLIDYGLVPGTTNGVFIRFDGADLGMPLRRLPSSIGYTQDGVSGGAGQGFVDQIGPFPE